MLSMLIYFALFLDSVNVMRNMKSISFFYLSIPFLIQRKALPYFILNLIGFGFHTSSIVYFPLYFILTKKYHKYVYWGIFLVGNFMVLSHINLFSNLLIQGASMIGGRVLSSTEEYMVKSMFNNYSAVSIGYLERMCSGILLLLFYDKLNALGKNMTLFYNLFFCMLFCRLFLAEFDTLPVRFSYLFMSSYCILYPAIYKELNMRWKIVFLAVVCLYAVIRVFQLGQDEHYLYHNVLFG